MPSAERRLPRRPLDPKDKNYIADVCRTIEIALDESQPYVECLEAAAMLWDLQVAGLREQQRMFRKHPEIMKDCVQGFAIGFTNAVKSGNIADALRKSIDQVEALLEPEKGN